MLSESFECKTRELISFLQFGLLQVITWPELCYGLETISGRIILMNFALRSFMSWSSNSLLYDIVINKLSQKHMLCMQKIENYLVLGNQLKLDLLIVPIVLFCIHVFSNWKFLVIPNHLHYPNT